LIHRDSFPPTRFACADNGKVVERNTRGNGPKLQSQRYENIVMRVARKILPARKIILPNAMRFSFVRPELTSYIAHCSVRPHHAARTERGPSRFHSIHRHPRRFIAARERSTGRPASQGRVYEH
jgi:hypothetical protein